MTGAAGVAYRWLVNHLRVLCVVALAMSASPALAERHAKPSAPVEVRLESRAVTGGYQVTLVAVPTRAVPKLELVLAGKHLAFAATAAGQRRELTVQVPLAPGAGVDVVGSAAAGTTGPAGTMRNRAAVLHLGAVRQQAPRPTVTRTLPDGRAVQEVR
jgi:hypothetical protein